MSYVVEQVKDGKYLSLAFKGEYANDELESSRDEITTALATNGWNKLLVDVTRATSKVSVTDDFYFVSKFPLYFPGVRIAISCPADELTQYQFIEDVAFNRGVNLKLFSDTDHALNWLHGK